MKKYLYFTGALAAMVLGQSCSENEILEEAKPLPVGTEISFGGNFDSDKSRTYYGEETTLNGATVWPIYWNNGDMTKDEVFIYSPQANGGRNQAVFTANAEAPDATTNAQAPAPLVKKGAYGIQVGATEGTYDFYAVYPGSLAYEGQATGTTIKATMPSNQTATFAGTSTSSSTTIPSPNAGDVNFVTTPDMKCCLMTGVNTGVLASDLDKSVNITFTPFATVLDITIHGPNNNVTVDNAARITTVTITETTGKAISGDFTVDFSGSTPTCTPAENASSVVVIDTQGMDSNGNMLGVPLCTPQSTLNVKAFLLPNTDVSNLKISMNSGFRQYSISVPNTNFKPSQIHKISLPVFDPQKGNFDYSTWLSQLDPRIYVSELSLPGAALSFNSAINGLSGDMITQTLSIENQFNNGIRVFQGHIDEKLNIVDSKGNICYKENTKTALTLSEAAGLLVREMQSTHSDEFCVFMVSDWIQSISDAKIQTMYESLKDALDSSAYGDYYVTDFDKNTTIADVKGKVIIKLQLNGSTMPQIQAWSKLNPSRAIFNWFASGAQKNIFYCPLAYGNVGSFSYTSTYDKETQSNKYDITQLSPGIAVDAANLFAEKGELNSTDLPTMATGMWYIYSEEANAGENYSNATTNITNVTGAISKTYVQSQHNKFYMVYCGGVGGGNNNVSSVTTGLASQWQKAVTNWGAMPYGWVLFNDVANSTIQGYIQTVIEQNNREDFPLERDRSNYVVPEKPDGDVSGVIHGTDLL